MQKTRLQKTLCIVLPLCLAACASPPKPLFAPVYVTDRAKYTLLPPADIEKPMDSYQQIAGTYGKHEFLLDALVVADEKGITVSLFNSLGTSMGEVFFDEKAASFSSSVFPTSFKPEYIIADFQFCFYRAEKLTEALGACGLTFAAERRQTAERGPVETRAIFERGKKIAEIEKTDKTIAYTNYLRGYSYALAGGFL